MYAMKRFCFGLLLLLCFSVAKATGPAADSSNKKVYTGDNTTDQAFADSAAIKAMAISAVEKVEQSDKWLETLQPDDLNELPIGLRRTVSNITYKVAISSAVFHETYAELTVFAKVKIPQRDEPLFFGISSLKLSYRGGIVGDAKLVLLGDCHIPIHGGNAMLILKGGFNLQNGQAQSGLTSLTIDCNGFKELSVAAQVEFPRSLLIPCDNSGNKITDTKTKVSAGFDAIITDWNDILITINLPKFQVNKLEGIVFTVSNAVFDFSDTRNSPAVTFPSGYEARYLHYPNPYMWRGVYIQTIDIELPKMFRRAGSTGQIGRASCRER